MKVKWTKADSTKLIIGILLMPVLGVVLFIFFLYLWQGLFSIGLIKSFNMLYFYFSIGIGVLVTITLCCLHIKPYKKILSILAVLIASVVPLLAAIVYAALDSF